IPAFEEAVFNGSTGQIFTIQTQYGVHIIEIQKQIGSSRVAKVAVIDKSLVSSSQTEQAAYQKAQAFLSQAKNQKEFREAAQKQKINKLVAEDVGPLQAGLPGLEEARSLIRWAYTADKGDISNEIFSISNKYVVAV